MGNYIVSIYHTYTYDGDTITAKSVFLEESNKEALDFIYSKFNFISLGCDNIRKTGKDALQSLYSLTRILPETKLTDPVF